VTLELGGPWRFYHPFWTAHGLAEMTAMDLRDFGPIGDGDDVRVPLVVTNPTSTDQTVSVTAVLPPGWVERNRPASIVIPANGQVEFGSSLTGRRPADGSTVITVSYRLGAGASGNTSPLDIHVYFEPHGNVLPQQ
jgi:hypothetical protein